MFIRAKSVHVIDLRLCLVVVLFSGVAGLCVLSGCRSKTVKPLNTSAHLDFNQDVQPILASNCYSCHGPDPGNRKAGLRLDLEESAFKKRPGHPDAIVPGHPELSELVKRVELHDPHRLMPQTAQGEAKPMKPEEIAVLKQWISEGAHYRPHWSFDEPVRAPAPAVADTGWAQNSIDTFILARLQKENLHPAPEADKNTLMRRVTLDLTGLLPTPQEVDAFVADTSPQAYEHLVDRLLAKPAYGEQRARYWMDYARFADTYGLHFDNNRNIWPYRDYVIRSFNANKPFDQFAKEQIAGDMLPAKSVDSLIASGYVRLGLSSNEGGTIPEELRTNIARERTEAYGATFMGLTVGCAVCHDHKYDPTTQKDFYQLTAFFNNLDEMPFNDDQPSWMPILHIPMPEHQQAYDKLVAQRSVLAAQLDTTRYSEADLVRQWFASHQNVPKEVSTDKLQIRLRLNEGGGDSIKNSAPDPTPASFALGKSKPQWGETTFMWPDFRLDTTTKVELGNAGDFEWNQPFSTGGWIGLRCAPNFTSLKVKGSLISKMDSTAHNRGWDISVEQGILNIRLINQAPKEVIPPSPPSKKKSSVLSKYQSIDDPEVLANLKLTRGLMETATDPADETPHDEIKVAAVQSLSADGAWTHVFFTYDGSGKASGIKLFVNGVQVQTKTIYDKLEHNTIRTSAPMQLGWRYPDAYPAHDTRYQDVRLYSRALTPDEIKHLPYEDYIAEIAATPPSQWTADQVHIAGEYYRNNLDVTTKSLQAQIKQLDAQMEKLAANGDITLIAREKPNLAYADILNRGVYTDRKERVLADTPHFLPPLAANLPHNRLGLAEWTVSSQNPLTARVTVNRMWNELFGTGLVETTEDFGIMGGRPSNPQLLDWLAVEFRESGWDIKHMYKLMVMSATYRQGAQSTPEDTAKDPRNLLLAHGPRFRMDAEELRDIALQSSGLLVNKIGGPSVRPYQPPNVWETVGIGNSDTLNYTQDHGDALYRRSMYTYWKRMAMQPSMDAFDAPARDVACTRRQRTDTPLQALVTMNDVQWVEASRALAQRTIKEGGQQSGQRIRYMSDLLLSRDPSPRMQAVLEASLTKMEQHYAADPKAAQALIATGESHNDPSIPAPELAAWTMVASEMLNLDETLNK